MSAADANESAGGAGMAQPGELVQGGLLCNISLFSNFFGTWALLSVLGLVSILGMSAVIFVKYYVHPTYDTWRRKSNPVYPKPHMVREEVLQMLKGLGTATLCPALTLYLSQRGVSHGYCGMGGRSLAYNAATFVATVVLSDLYEWYYHRLGHLYKPFWAHHKAHHIFFNPSPFAVIADDYVDQFMRSLPLVILPAVFPLNIDMMFLTYVVLFYGYGVYLHWGHEVDWPDAHHPWINTAYQHYCHHAHSLLNKPYHTGFFVKFWDILAGSVWPADKCGCVKCQAEKGLRSREEWEKVKAALPDYSVLKSPRYWLTGDGDAVKKTE